MTPMEIFRSACSNITSRASLVMTLILDMMELLLLDKGFSIAWIPSQNALVSSIQNYHNMIAGHFLTTTTRLFITIDEHQ